MEVARKKDALLNRLKVTNSQVMNYNSSAQGRMDRVEDQATVQER